MSSLAFVSYAAGSLTWSCTVLDTKVVSLLSSKSYNLMNFRLLMKQRSHLILVKSFHTLIKLTLDGGKDLGLMVSCQENVRKGKAQDRVAEAR